MVTELDLTIERAFVRFKESERERIETQSLLNNRLAQIPPAFRWFILLLDRTKFDVTGIKVLQGELRKRQGSETRYKDRVDFEVGKRPGTYQVRKVDIINTARPWTRVQFVHMINAEPYIATYQSSFIQGQLALNTGQRRTAEGLKPPTFTIRDKNHPLLRLTADFPVRLFENFTSTDFVPKKITMKKMVEAVYPYLLTD